MARLSATTKGIRFLIVCLIAGGCGGGSGGSSEKHYSVTISWEAPTTNEDGTPLTDLAGFKIYTTTGQDPYRLLSDTITQTTYTADSLPRGTHFFAVTAYDFTGNESGFSEATEVTLPRPEESGP